MARRSWSLPGKTILITGAARGIGAESARRLSARGARVALAGLEPDELERVAAQCGPDAAWFECDVTDSEALARVVEASVERFGGVDAVMANAGIAPAGMVRSTHPDAFDATVEVNLLGVWRTVRAALPQIIERRGYVLVNASLAAVVNAPGMAAYSASKAGAEAFANSLRAEVRHLGVDVGVAYFGFIATDLFAGGEQHPVYAGLRDALSGPIGRSYPVSTVGEAVARGVEERRRWVTVPGWLRAVLLLRGPLALLADVGRGRQIEELDRRFEDYVAERGAAEASAPFGRGGAAMRDRAASRR
jgi:NAD(P)-dependent dehydrogenase (short-subunit alcohol dehydrogenase family)